VRPRRFGHFLAARDDAPKALVGRDLPAHGRSLGQAVAGEARPQDPAMRVRLAGGDAEGEALGIGRAGASGQPRGRDEGGGTAEEASPRAGRAREP
jgi:hypothetical protein